MDRKLNRDRLASVLRGFRDNCEMRPVIVFCESDLPGVHLLNGTHRWRASFAFGFAQIPAISVDHWQAEEAGYQSPSRGNRSMT